MTSYQYPSRIFTGKRIENPHSYQYPHFDIRTELKAEADANTSLDNTFKKQSIIAPQSRERLGFLEKMYQRIKGLFYSSQGSRTERVIRENDYRNLQIDPPFSSKTDYSKLVNGGEAKVQQFGNNSSFITKDASRSFMNSNKDLKNFERFYHLANNEQVQVFNSKEERKIMLEQIRASRLAEKLQQKSKSYDRQVETNTNTHTVSNANQVQSVQVTKASKGTEKQINFFYPDTKASEKSQLVTTSKEIKDIQRTSLSKGLLNPNPKHENRPRKRKYSPKDIQDENRMRRLREVESIFNCNKVQLETEKIPRIETKKLKMTDLKTPDPKAVISEEPKSISSKSKKSLMISEKQDLIPMNSNLLLPPGKEYQKKEGGQFNNRSIESDDTQSCSNFQQENRFLEKDFKDDSYHNVMDYPHSNVKGQYSSTTTNYSTPAEEQQILNPLLTFSKTEFPKPLNRDSVPSTEKSIEYKPSITLEKIDQKEGALSNPSNQNNQVYTQNKMSSTYIETESNKLNNEPVQKTTAIMNKDISNTISTNNLQTNLSTVDDSSVQNSRNTDIQKREPIFSSNLVLKDSLEKTNDFLHSLQSNPFLTNNSNISIANNPFVSANNFNSGQNSTNVNIFSLESIIKQNANSHSSLLNPMQHDSNIGPFSNISQNIDSKLNPTSPLDNLFRNSNNTNATNQLLPSESNRNVNISGNSNNQMSTNLSWNSNGGGNMMQEMNQGTSQNQGSLKLDVWNNNTGNGLNNLFNGNYNSSQKNGINSSLLGNGLSGINTLYQNTSQNPGSFYQGQMTNNAVSNSNPFLVQSSNSISSFNPDSNVANLFREISNTNSSSNNPLLQGTESRPYRVLKGIKANTAQRMNNFL